ncbi:hypothetical protein [Alkalitalea saponilacus]|uniref:Uncharacterized protein n=1 Tax=Alkalitalea saponilacus TaxID=889453 RepID=A0A1T5CDN9_9BACT|nr:hypothetical protein [Alkalitalea saponilacus]SKB57567.1 hypothetical protein SAMN03080601_00780 [Alkalitalea saponilacus]
MKRSKWLTYVAPVPALVMLFTMLFQSFHKMEHFAECHESHACCHIPHHNSISAVVNYDGDLWLIEAEDVSTCLVCQYEFTFCSELKRSIAQAIVNLPHSPIPGLNIALHHSFTGLHKQLRAPPPSKV